MSDKLEKIVLSLFSKNRDGDEVQELARMTDPEWRDILHFAGVQGLLPLLQSSLKSPARTSAVPDWVRNTLRTEYYGRGLLYAGIYRELAEVLKAAVSEEIPIILLKGTHLGPLVYGNIAHRQIGDIDLLVKPRDIPGIEKLLEQMGYRMMGVEGRLAASVELGMSHELPPFYKTQAGQIDVHWTLENPKTPFKIDVDGLWERAKPVRLNGTPALVLGAEDLLLHLALHSAYHHKFEFGLVSLLDISQVVHCYRPQIDWHVLASRADQWGCSKHLYISLKLAAELLGAEVPETVLKALEPEGFDSEIIKMAKEKIMKIDRPEVRTVSPNLALLWGPKPSGRKLAVYLRNIFPPRKDLTRMYSFREGSFRMYFYYLVRLRDLARRYGLRKTLRLYVDTSWKMLRHPEERRVFAESEDPLAEWLRSN